MNRINRLATALLVCAGLATGAQKSLLGRFLQAAQNDSQIVDRRNHASLLRKAPFSMPLFEDAEVRVRNRAFDFGGQRYTFRLEPRGVGETKALNALKRAQLSYEETMNGYALNDLLLDRYVYFIDMLERKSLAMGYTDLIPVYEDRIRVMEQLQNSTDFDLTDLIKAEKELAKLISEKIEEEQEVATADRYLWTVVGDSLSGGIDTTGLISVTAIKKEVLGINFVLDENNIYLKQLENQFAFSEKRYTLEKSQNRRVLSFLEFSYDAGSYNDELARRSDKKEYDLYNAYIMEIGIKLPFISAARENVARRQIDFLNDKEEYNTLRRELAKKMKKDEDDIKAYIERYELLTARETEVDAEASLKKYLQMSGVDPLALLAIKESVIKNRMEKEKIYFSILRNFIYVMDVTGRLIQTPLVNLLSAQREAVEQ
ncbi:MAG: hypothetical protein JXA18_04410 [Chitinispirillaceae bacterium]|nr:hypothetical protein [Chitinispirillaceae bacterium]